MVADRGAGNRQAVLPHLQLMLDLLDDVLVQVTQLMVPLTQAGNRLRQVVLPELVHHGGVVHRPKRTAAAGGGGGNHPGSMSYLQIEE